MQYCVHVVGIRKYWYEMSIRINQTFSFLPMDRSLPPIPEPAGLEDWGIFKASGHGTVSSEVRSRFLAYICNKHPSYSSTSQSVQHSSVPSHPHPHHPHLPILPPKAPPQDPPNSTPPTFLINPRSTSHFVKIAQSALKVIIKIVKATWVDQADSEVGHSMQGESRGRKRVPRD